MTAGPRSYDTGGQAVRRGWFYIVLEVMLFVIFIATLVRVWAG